METHLGRKRPILYKPALCNNPSVISDSATLDKFEDKIDFWAIAFFGAISDEDVIRYAHHFDEKRHVAKLYGNDGSPDYNITQIGWQNFLFNPKFVLTEKLDTFFRMRKTKIIQLDIESSAERD